MTTKSFTDKNNNEWTWEETPEVLAALKKLHGTVEAQRPHDYPGPLYAPHPDLIKNNDKTEPT